MKKNRAFTLIELMIVVAIIGILAAISAPKFADLIAKSKDGSTKGALAVLRSALAVYYADNTLYPADDLTSLSVDQKYISKIPSIQLSNTGHAETRLVTAGASLASYITDAGGWAYINDSASHDWGRLAVNCSHFDNTSLAWSLF